MSAGRSGKLDVDRLSDDQLADALTLGADDYGWDYQAAVGLILEQWYWLSQYGFRRAVNVEVNEDGRTVAWVKWADVELTSAASSGQEKILELACSIAGIANTEPLGELLTGLGIHADEVVRAIEFAAKGTYPPPNDSTVVLDPLEGGLVDALWKIHDWARFRAGTDDPDSEAVVDRLGDLVADVAIKLGVSAKTAPKLYAPDGRDLASLIPLEADLRGLARALNRARLAVPDAGLPPDALKAVDLLDRCAVCSRLDEGVIAAVARSEARAKRLDDAQYGVYRRYASLVLVDPLDRFAAMGLDPASPPVTEADPTSVLRSNKPEIGV